MARCRECRDAGRPRVEDRAVVVMVMCELCGVHGMFDICESCGKVEGADCPHYTVERMQSIYGNVKEREG